MTARTFGRRGLGETGAGGVSARRAALLGAGSVEPARLPAADADDVAARRAAFLAEERARAEKPARETLAFDLKPEDVAAAEANFRSRRSIAVAYLLWLAIGVTGAHRFYLGRPLTGALQFALAAGSWAMIATENYAAVAGIFATGLWLFVDGLVIRTLYRRAAIRARHRAAAAETFA